MTLLTLPVRPYFFIKKCSLVEMGNNHLFGKNAYGIKHIVDKLLKLTSLEIMANVQLMLKCMPVI